MVTVNGELNVDLNGGTNVNAGTLTAAVTYNNAAVQGATVTWSSSDTDVATINETTGAVTLLATGEVTFTATYAGNDDYAGATDTKTITVVDSSAPSIAVAPDEVSVDAGEHDGTLALTYENLTISQMDDFDVQYYNAAGEEISDPDWIEVLVAEQDPAIGDGYVVSYYMIENEGAARSAYFKVFAMGNEDLVYSNLVTVTQAAAPFVVKDGVFNFVEAASQDEDYGSGVETTTDGQYYETNSSTWTAGNVTLVASGKYRWWKNDGTLRFYSNTPQSAITISVPEGKVITKIVVTGGTNFIVNCGNYNSGTWTGYSNSVVLTYPASTGSVNVKTITVTYVDAYQPTGITLNGSGYATFASTSAVDFTNANGYTAWAITGVSGETITFSQITGAVAAGTGVLLKGTANAEVTIAYTTSGDILSENKLEGVVAPKTIDYYQYYGLSGAKFVKVNAGTVPAGKALLPASVVDGTSGVNAFTFNFDDDATGIEAIENGQLTIDDAIYNLAGQRLNKMQKGINIVNGKKILK